MAILQLKLQHQLSPNPSSPFLEKSRSRDMTVSHIPEFNLSQTNRWDISFKLDELAANSGYNPGAPHRHNHYEIFFFKEGGGLHMIDFQEIEIKAGDIHILSPGQIHYMHRDMGSSGWVLKFTPEFFLSTEFNAQNAILTQLLAASLIRPNEGDFMTLMLLVDQIQDEYKSREKGFEAMIYHYLHVLLLTCNRRYDATSAMSDSADRKLFYAFQQNLEQFFREQNRVTFYSEKLGVSTDKLNHAVKSATGSSSSEMISHRLLLEAKRWLLHSEKSIKEIAYQLNFQDHAYFNRWFKKLSACSPGEFRKAIREKYHV